MKNRYCSSNWTFFTALVTSLLLYSPQLYAADQTARINHKLDKLENRLSDLEERIKINGFFSAGLVTGDEEAEFDILGIYDDPSTIADAVGGVQFTVKVTDKLNYVSQFVARGNEDYDVEMAWNFISYKMNNSLTLRAGKMRLPYYMASEYLEVGYAYPWVRPPNAMYRVVLDNYTGYEATYKMLIGQTISNTKVFYGSAQASDTDFALDIQDLVGMETLLEWENWIFRIGYTRGKFTIGGSFLDPLDEGIAGIQAVMRGFIAAAPALVPTNLVTANWNKTASTSLDQDTYDFTSAGMQYDNGSTLVIAEVVRSHIAGFLPSRESGYITAGYRIETWLPYVTIGKTYTHDDEMRNQYAAAAEWIGTSPFLPAESVALSGLAAPINGFSTEYDQYTLGVRWDIMSNVALKFAVDHFSSFGKSGGPFSNSLDTDGNTDVYSFIIDSMF